MQRVHLDFVAKRPPTGLAGWVLLICGVVGTLSLLAWDRWYWQPLNAAGEAKLSAIQRAIDAHHAAVPKMDDTQLVAEWTHAIAVADELNLPWDALFKTLENEAQRPVALLALEPDAGKRELVLTAEAKNFAEMLDYYRLLQQQPIFSGLALHTHQINRQDRENPVRFRVTAKWTVKS